MGPMSIEKPVILDFTLKKDDSFDLTHDHSDDSSETNAQSPPQSHGNITSIILLIIFAHIV